MIAEYQFIRELPVKLKSYAELCIATKNKSEVDEIYTGEATFSEEELKQFDLDENQARKALLSAAIAVRTHESFEKIEDSTIVFSMVLRQLMFVGELLDDPLTEIPWLTTAENIEEKYPDLAAWIRMGQARWQKINEQSSIDNSVVIY